MRKEYFYLKKYRHRHTQANCIHIVDKRNGYRVTRVRYHARPNDYHLCRYYILKQLNSEYREGLIKLNIERI